MREMLAGLENLNGRAGLLGWGASSPRSMLCALRVLGSLGRPRVCPDVLVHKLVESEDVIATTIKTQEALNQVCGRRFALPNPARVLTFMGARDSRSPFALPDSNACAHGTHPACGYGSAGRRRGDADLVPRCA